ncbi:hypothetical protein JCM17846_03530 [Iodidimonas nitroreducens]|uniref:Uncharacterized protein n=1 Tax=Iodidimonas nitroreducens TaxID=1236968 RepID=A0A5A7N321_9PROT|nr:hypothetical protein [Iodidimonas nitroreducens]GER02671.1 hypothetical protein JCM17846_03530 [Iodidimonas nitroreducens]
MKSSDEPFTLLDKRYPSGTLIFEIGDNDPGLNTKLAALVETTGARIVGVNTSWVTDGPSFGSNKVLPHLPIRIAMAWMNPPTAIMPETAVSSSNAAMAIRSHPFAPIV